MLLKLKNKKAQSTAEYAVLIGLVVAAAVGMQTYVKRGVQAKVRDAGDGYVNSVKSAYTDITDADLTGYLLPKEVAISKQYEPENLESKSTQDTITDEEHLVIEKGGTLTREITQKTKQGDDDFQKYGY